MRLIFAGTPAVAVPALRALAASSHEVVAVLTRPPAPFGRKRVLTPSPVHSEAETLGIPVLTASPTDPSVMEVLRGVDLVTVVAYGALIREPALSTPRHGWINLHFSLLPRWRGAAPVQYAIMEGDTLTGASVFQIEAGLDTGPVYGTVSEPIGEGATAGDLLERLTQLGVPLLVSTVDDIAGGTAVARMQDGEVTLAPTLHSMDAEVSWDAAATRVVNLIRGVTPAPGAWTRAPGGRMKLAPVSLTDVQGLRPGQVRVSPGEVLVGTGTTAVALERIAPPGKSWMNAADWARGLRDTEITLGEQQ